MKKVFLCAAVAMLALVGCEKQVQSELDFDKVEKTATVSGQLIAHVSNPGEATQTIALGGVRVYVQVASNKYMTAAEGNQQFFPEGGVTKEDGSFSIKVKTGAKEIAGGRLKTDDFIFKVGEKEVYFEAVDVALDNLNNGDIRLEQVIAKQDAVLNEIPAKGTLRGAVTYNKGWEVNVSGNAKEEREVKDAPAAGVKVVARVTYFKGEPSEVVKKFTATADKDGKYSFVVPAEELGNDVLVDVLQTALDYFPRVENYEAKAVKYYYSAADEAATAKANEVNTKDITLVQGAPVEAEADEYKSFKVSGRIFQQAEEADKNDDNETIGWHVGKTNTSYAFTVLVENVANGESIVYEGNKANSEGAYSLTIKVLKDWDWADMKISVYADKTNQVTGDNGYAHRYHKCGSDHELAEATAWKTQNVPGIYKGGKDNVLLVKWVSSDQEFFTLKLGDAIIPFSAEEPASVLGRMSPTAGADAQGGDYTEEIYVGGDGSKNKKFYRKADVYSVDIKKADGKTFLENYGGTSGLWK